MRDQMKFVNHIGEVIEFGKDCILINENDFRNYQWEYETQNERIKSFNKKITQKTLPIIVLGKESKKAADKLFEVIEKDVIENKPGKMYIGNYYISGFFYGKNNSDYTQKNTIIISLKFITTESVWVKEERKRFYPQTEPYALSGLDFPTDFSFDFASNDAGTALWNIDHYAPSHFEMIIYGPCVNPRVLVNGYSYQIFTELESNDYLILDSKNHTVTKYLANGTTANLYNSRQFTPSVFEKIPGGQLTLNWSGAFGFDIILFVERSEPKW